MKITQYLLRYTFVLGVTLSMSFVLGPTLIKKALKPIEKELQTVKMQKIDVSYLNENTDRYIKVKFTFNNKTFKQIYFVPENEHIKLEAFLCRNELINSTSNICKLNKSTLPILLKSQQLSLLPKPKVSIGKNEKLEYLQFGEDIVIGKSSTLIGKVLLVILGILFSLFGILLLFAASVYTFQNFRNYRQTGELSGPPNTIDEMIKGFKLILGKSNKQK